MVLSMNEFLLEELVRALTDLAEPGSGCRAIVTLESVRKAQASCRCVCDACSSEEDEDGEPWA